MVRHPGAAAVVPLLSGPDQADPTVLLIRQYRYAADGMVWEIAGVLEPGARNRGGIGGGADATGSVTTIFTTPGSPREIHLFLATGIRGGTATPNADEFIETAAVPMSRALGMIRDGEIRDGKTVVALFYVAGFRLNL
jgi:ADP-ribose pyrophosphatase